MLKQADTGIDWDTIVAGHTADATTTAEQMNLCVRATELADLYCGQVLRSTTDTEHLDAPSERAWILRNQVLRCLVARWPVTSVVSVQISPATIPRSFTTLPTNAYLVRQASSDTISAAGAYMVDIAPGYVSWSNGRYGYEVDIQYANGWPHTKLTANAASGATSISVDDISGFVVNAYFSLYDGSNTELALQVASITPNTSGATAGPGTIGLVAGLSFAHTVPTAPDALLVSQLPAAIQQACIYLATDIALTRGATALTLRTADSGGTLEGAQGGGSRRLVDEGYAILNSFRRVI